MAVAAGAAGDSLALITGRRLIRFGGLRPPPTAALLRRAGRRGDPVRTRVARHEARGATNAVLVAVLGAEQSAAAVAAADRFFAADVTGHEPIPAPPLRS